LALSVLVVDNDREWQSACQKFLEDNLYEVKVCDNGKSAQLALYNDSYFAVILNLDVKNHSGLEVLKFIKKTKPGQKVIVVVNDEKKLEEDELGIDQLVKKGATEVLVKPFEMENIRDALEGQQGISDMIQTISMTGIVRDEEEVDVKDDEFCEIKIDEFYSSKAVLFDIFIKLKKGKYVKILHCGDNFSKERVDKYKNEKKVEFFYYHKSDRRKYVQYLNFLAGKAVENDKLDTNSKVKLLRTTATNLVEESFVQGFKPQVIDQGKQLAESVYNFVTKEPELWKLLKEYEELDPNAYSHSFLCTIYATAIIKQFEWQSKTMIETAAMACLFHDIGLSQLDPKFLDMDEADMSEEELEIYKTHPKIAFDMLEGQRMVKSSVRQVILQHHECYDGTGYPSGMSGNRVLTLANILRLADEFSLLLKKTQKKPVEVLKMMLEDKKGIRKYNSLIVENFIKTFANPEKLGKSYTLPSNSRIVPNKKAS
jgi:response regulator RpfG family c-di-GMP phosphodiesterase